MQCTLSIPDGSYYDIILSNNENIEEIHMEYESKLRKTKLNAMNPYMTDFSFPEEPESRVFTIYDAFGQQMDSFERTGVSTNVN